MKYRILPLFVLTVLITVMAVQAQTKAAPVATDEQILKAALQRLKKFKVPDNEKAVLVPEPVRQDITLAKTALFRIIVKTLNAQELHLTDKQLTVFIIGSLKVKGISVLNLKKDEECESAYGCILGIELKHSAARPDIILLTTHFTVAAGNDGSLYVLEYVAGHWQPALVFEAAPYKEITGTHEGIEAALSSLGAGQPWYIAVSYTNAALASVWQHLTVSILSKGTTSVVPKTEYTVSDTVNIGESRSIRGDRSGFTIRYTTDFPMDEDKLSRINILHLERKDSAWKRTAPFTDSAEGLVDEWMRLKWDDAADLSDRSNLAVLQEWHRKLAQPKKGVQFSLNDSYECGAGSGLWRVMIDVDFDDGVKTALPPTVYFNLLMTKTDQRVLEVSPVAFNECPQTKIARSVWDRMLGSYFVEPELLSSSSAR